MRKSGLAITLTILVILDLGCAGSNGSGGSGLTGTTYDQARSRIRGLTDAFRIYLADNDEGTPAAGSWMEGLAPYTDSNNFLAPGIGNEGAGI